MTEHQKKQMEKLKKDNKHLKMALNSTVKQMIGCSSLILKLSEIIAMGKNND